MTGVGSADVSSGSWREQEGGGSKNAAAAAAKQAARRNAADLDEDLHGG